MKVLANAKLTFTRTLEGAIVDGWVSDGSTTSYTAEGNLQPAGKSEIDFLEDGYKGRDLKLFITPTIITNNDKTTIDGVSYFAKIKEDFTGNLSVGNCEVILISEQGEDVD